MKPFKNNTILTLVCCALLLLTACDHDISTGSRVYEDGSLDRTIVLHKTDSDHVASNIFGVNEARDWKVEVVPATGSAKENREAKHNVTFKKHFKSVADANSEMHRAADTLFEIRSSFEKKDRWFYTYLEYSDTYVSLNRFKAIPQEDFFTEEDYAFIDRLPAEGSAITKSDSLYLARLDEKIFDLYGARTIFEELYADMLASMREHNVPANWTDTLLLKKENVYRRFFREGNLDDADLLYAAEGMKIPLPVEVQEAIRRKTEEMEKRLDFISKAYSGKFVHTINMPWKVVSSNADSVKGNALYWNPPVIKFLLKDYTMTASARQMNVVAVIISGGLVLITLGLFFFRRRKVSKA